MKNKSRKNKEWCIYYNKGGHECAFLESACYSALSCRSYKEKDALWNSKSGNGTKQKKPPYFIDIEKSETMLRFNFYCNNVSIRHFNLTDDGTYTASFSYKHRGTMITCKLNIVTDDFNQYFPAVKLPRAKVQKTGYNLDIVFHGEYKYANDLDKPHAAIPNVITVRKALSSPHVKYDLEISCDKKDYLQLIGYRHKRLPSSVIEKRGAVPYKGVSTKPLQGGGVSPR